MSVPVVPVTPPSSHEPRVVSTPQQNKILQDLQECIKQLREDFTEYHIPVNDDNQILHRFCAKLEFLLQAHMKDKYSMLGRKKDYWDYIVESLSSTKGLTDGIRYVKSLGEHKTSLGKGRAFLRFSLVHQRLPDSIQQCVMNPRKSDWYHPQSIWFQEDKTGDLIGSLYDLNDVNFDLSPKGYDLDNAWPSFAKKQSGNYNWNVPSRRSSIGSLASLQMISADSQKLLNMDSSDVAWSPSGELYAVTEQLKDVQRHHDQIVENYEDLTKRYDQLLLEQSEWKKKESGFLVQDQQENHELELASLKSELESSHKRMAAMLEQHQREKTEKDNACWEMGHKLKTMEQKLVGVKEIQKKGTWEIENLQRSVNEFERRNEELLVMLEQALEFNERESGTQLETVDRVQGLIRKLKEGESENLRMSASINDVENRFKACEAELASLRVVNAQLKNTLKVEKETNKSNILLISEEVSESAAAYENEIEKLKKQVFRLERKASEDSIGRSREKKTSEHSIGRSRERKASEHSIGRSRETSVVKRLLEERNAFLLESFSAFCMLCNEDCDVNESNIASLSREDLSEKLSSYVNILSRERRGLRNKLTEEVKLRIRFENDLHMLEKENLEISDSLHLMEKLHDILKTSHEQLESCNEQTTMDHEQLKINHEQLGKDYEQLKIFLEHLQRYGGITPDHEQLQKDLEQLRRDCQQLEEDNEQVEINHEQLKISFEQMKTDHDQLKINNEQLKINYEQLKTDHKELKIDREELIIYYEELKEDHEQLENSQELSRKSYEQLRVDYKQLNITHEQLKIDHEKLEKDNKELKINGEQLEKDHKQLKTDYEQLKTDHEQLKTIPEQLGTDHEQLGTDHEQLKTDHEQLKTIHEQLGTDHEQLKTILEQLGTNHEQLKTDHEQLKTIHEQLGTDDEQLKTDHEQLKTIHEQLGTDHEQLKTDHGQLKTDHEQLKTDLDQLKTNHKQLGTDRQQFAQGQYQLKISHEHLENAHEQLKTDNEQLKMALEKLNIDSKQLKMDHEQFKTVQVRLQMDHDQLNIDYEQLKATHNQLQTDHEQLKADREQLKPTNEQLKTDYEQLKTDQEQLKAIHNQLKTDYEQLKTNRELLKATHNQLKTDYEQLKTDREQMETDREQSPEEEEQVKRSDSETEIELRMSVSSQHDVIEAYKDSLEVTRSQLVETTNILESRCLRLDEISSELSMKTGILESRSRSLDEVREELVMKAEMVESRRQCLDTIKSELEMKCELVNQLNTTLQSSRNAVFELLTQISGSNEETLERKQIEEQILEIYRSSFEMEIIGICKSPNQSQTTHRREKRIAENPVRKSCMTQSETKVLCNNTRDVTGFELADKTSDTAVLGRKNRNTVSFELANETRQGDKKVSRRKSCDSASLKITEETTSDMIHKLTWSDPTESFGDCPNVTTSKATISITESIAKDEIITPNDEKDTFYSSPLIATSELGSRFVQSEIMVESVSCTEQILTNRMICSDTKESKKEQNYEVISQEVNKLNPKDAIVSCAELHLAVTDAAESNKERKDAVMSHQADKSTLRAIVDESDRFCLETGTCQLEETSLDEIVEEYDSFSLDLQVSHKMSPNNMTKSCRGKQLNQKIAYTEVQESNKEPKDLVMAQANKMSTDSYGEQKLANKMAHTEAIGSYKLAGEMAYGEDRDVITSQVENKMAASHSCTLVSVVVEEIADGDSDDIMSQLADISAEMDRLSGVTTSQQDDMTTEIDRLSVVKSVQLARIKDLLGCRSQHLNQIISDLDTKTEVLKFRNQHLNKIKSDLDAKAVLLQSKSQCLDHVRSKLEMNTEAMNVTLEKSWNDVNKLLKQLTLDKDKLEECDSVTEEVLTADKLNIQTLETKVSDLTAERDSLSTQLRHLQSNDTDRGRELCSIQENLKHLLDSLASSRAMETDLRKQLLDRETELRQKVTEMADVQETVEKFNLEISHLNDVKKETEEENEILRAHLLGLEKKVSSFTFTMAITNEKLEEASNMGDSIIQENKDMEANLKQKDADLEEKRMTINMMEVKLEGLNTEVEEMKSAREMCDLQIHGLEKEFSEAELQKNLLEERVQDLSELLSKEKIEREIIEEKLKIFSIQNDSLVSIQNQSELLAKEKKEKEEIELKQVSEQNKLFETQIEDLSRLLTKEKEERENVEEKLRNVSVQNDSLVSIKNQFELLAKEKKEKEEIELKQVSEQNKLFETQIEDLSRLLTKEKEERENVEEKLRNVSVQNDSLVSIQDQSELLAKEKREKEEIELKQISEQNKLLETQVEDLSQLLTKEKNGRKQTEEHLGRVSQDVISLTEKLGKQLQDFEIKEKGYNETIELYEKEREELSRRLEVSLTDTRRIEKLHEEFDQKEKVYRNTIHQQEIERKELTEKFDVSVTDTERMDKLRKEFDLKEKGYKDTILQHQTKGKELTKQLEVMKDSRRVHRLQAEFDVKKKGYIEKILQHETEINDLTQQLEAALLDSERVQKLQEEFGSKEKGYRETILQHEMERKDLTQRLEEALLDTGVIKEQLTDKLKELEEVCSLKSQTLRENEDLKSSLRVLDSSYREVKDKLSAYEKDGVDAARLEQDVLESSMIMSLNQEIENLKLCNSRCLEDKDSSVKALQDEVHRLKEGNKEIKQLETEKMATEERVSSAEEKIMSAEERATTAKERATTAKERATTAKKRATTDKERATTDKERATTSAVDELSSLRAEISEKEKLLNDKVCENDDYLRLLRNLKQCVTALETSLADKSSRCEELEGSLSEQCQKFEELEKHFSIEKQKLRNQVELMTQEASALQFQLSVEQLQHEDALKCLTSDTESVSSLHTRISQLETLIAQLQQEVASQSTSRSEETQAQTQQLTDLQCELRVRTEEIQRLSQLLHDVEDCLEQEKDSHHQLQEVNSKQMLERDEQISVLQSDRKQLTKKLVQLVRDKDVLWQRTDQLTYEQKVKASEKWVDGGSVTHCLACNTEFSLWLRKHHCRLCGRIFCYNCSDYWVDTAHSSKKERSCENCYNHLHTLESDTNVSILSNDSDDEFTASVTPVMSCSSSSYSGPSKPESVTDNTDSTKTESLEEQMIKFASDNEPSSDCLTSSEDKMEPQLKATGDTVTDTELKTSGNQSPKAESKKSDEYSGLVTSGKENVEAESKGSGGDCGQYVDNTQNASEGASPIVFTIGTPNDTDDRKVEKIKGESPPRRSDPEDPFHVITEEEVTRSLSEYDTNLLDQAMGPKNVQADVYTMQSSLVISAEELAQGEINSYNEVWVKPGNRFAVPVVIQTPNTVLSWQFSSYPKDIVFSVGYRETATTPLDASMEVLPPCKCNSHREPVRGEVTAKTPGVYTLIFDNSYSKMTSKKVHYILNLMTTK